MAQTMKAVRFHDRQKLGYDDIPIPELKKGQVKLRPAWCGICGTDLHEYMGGPSLIPTTPHPLTREKAPLTIGHEFSAVVEELGEGVTKYKKGDHVVVRPIIYDGTCGPCKAGIINCCQSNGFVGISGFGGGMSELIVLDEHYLIPIPDSIPLEIGALVEPLSVAWHAINRAEMKPGNSALILGGGPIGLAVLQCLKARGAGQVIVSEVASKRKDYAKEFGADVVLDPSTQDIAAKCKELTDNMGVDVVFDCAGVQRALDSAIDSLRAHGTFLSVAVWEKPHLFPAMKFMFPERRYVGTATFVAGDFEAVVEAIASGKLKPEKMITKKVKMSEVEEEGFKELINNKDKHVKVLVECGKP